MNRYLELRMVMQKIHNHEFYKCLQNGHYPNVTYNTCYNIDCEHRDEISQECTLHTREGFLNTWNPKKYELRLHNHKTNEIVTIYYNQSIAYTCNVCDMILKTSYESEEAETYD